MTNWPNLEKSENGDNNEYVEAATKDEKEKNKVQSKTTGAR